MILTSFFSTLQMINSVGDCSCLVFGDFGQLAHSFAPLDDITILVYTITKGVSRRDCLIGPCYYPVQPEVGGTYKI